MYSSTGRMALYHKVIQNEMSFSKLNIKQSSSKRAKDLGIKGMAFFILDKMMLTMFGVILA